MGLMDAFMADTKIEIKVRDLYELMKVSAKNEVDARCLLNGVKCEVPYKHIREVITGEKEEVAAEQTASPLPDCTPANMTCEKCPNKEKCEAALEDENAEELPECIYTAGTEKSGGGKA